MANVPQRCVQPEAGQRNKSTDFRLGSRAGACLVSHCRWQGLRVWRESWKFVLEPCSKSVVFEHESLIIELYNLEQYYQRHQHH